MKRIIERICEILALDFTKSNNVIYPGGKFLDDIGQDIDPCISTGRYVCSGEGSGLQGLRLAYYEKAREISICYLRENNSQFKEREELIKNDIKCFPVDNFPYLLSIEYDRVYYYGEPNKKWMTIKAVAKQEFKYSELGCSPWYYGDSVEEIYTKYTLDIKKHRKLQHAKLQSHIKDAAQTHKNIVSAENYLVGI